MGKLCSTASAGMRNADINKKPSTPNVLTILENDKSWEVWK